MKQKLNIFCVLLLLLIVVSFVLTCIDGADDFRKGWEDGANHNESMGLYDIFCMLMVLASFPMMIYSFSCFFRFILNVNHGEVFTWENVSLLRIVGWCLVVTPVLLILALSPDLENVLDTSTGAISFVIDGVFILIITEVFVIGLKLKEEQDLTI